LEAAYPVAATMASRVIPDLALMVLGSSSAGEVGQAPAR